MAIDNGWIKLYRNLMDDCLWQTSTPETKVVMLTVLMMANHEANEWIWNGQKFKCEPGQSVTSVKSITANCGAGVTECAVRCALKKLEKYGFLTVKTSKTGSLFTITNWSKYQGADEKATKRRQKKADKPKEETPPEGEVPVWKTEGFSSEANYKRFLRGEISEPC